MSQHVLVSCSPLRIFSMVFIADIFDSVTMTHHFSRTTQAWSLARANKMTQRVVGVCANVSCTARWR
jgi:hypothetical protein